MASYLNVSLVGMPGVGKSTVGVLLAKRLAWGFLDTDVMIQVIEERSLRDIIYTEGLERLAHIEQRHVLALDRRECVIAAGCTVVYGPAAMEHLKSLGLVVHLDLPLSILEQRLAGLNGHGPVFSPGQTLHGIYQQRSPLYRHYAGVAVDCADLTQEEIVDEIVKLMG
ncbi:MAG TPA: shikimate kinase [Thermoguttaceae bacterium]|nr:shikimate kinase [Thermoguttaceae bacterium]